MKSNQPAFQRRFTPKEGGEGLPKIAYTRRLCLKRGTLGADHLTLEGGGG